MLLRLFLILIVPVVLSQDKLTIPAVRVVRLQLNYKEASVSEIQRTPKWNSLLRNSVLASLRFINKHWLICGQQEKPSNDCGKAQVTGEMVSNSHYRINVTFIGERDPIKNAKVDATSTVSAVAQIGLKGGIFQYTNALKVLGKPEQTLSFDEAFFCYKGATLIDGDKCRLCSPGTFYDDPECTFCPRGTFQDIPGSPKCIECPTGTTSSKGASHISHCYHICPAGYFFDGAARVCEPCGLRGYQPEKGEDQCISCPLGTVPLYLNSTSIDHCLENCEPGRQRSIDGAKCETCPLGSFKSVGDAVCMLCPPGKTTTNKGSKDLASCSMRTCFPGTYLNISSGQCQACHYGLYQDEYDARICKKCPVNTTTYKTGSNAVTQCQSTNQCKSGLHNCHWLAVCMDLPDEPETPRFSCKCKPGYIGNGITCTDACDGYCSNDAECLKTGRGEVRCICKKGFKGRRCEIFE